MAEGNLGQQVAVLLSVAVENTKVMDDLRSRFTEFEHLSNEEFITTFRMQFQTSEVDKAITRLRTLGKTNKEVADAISAYDMAVERSKRSTAKAGLERPFEALADSINGAAGQLEQLRGISNRLEISKTSMEDILTGKTKDKTATSQLAAARAALTESGEGFGAGSVPPTTIQTQPEMARWLLENLKAAEAQVQARMTTLSHELAKGSKDFADAATDAGKDAIAGGATPKPREPTPGVPEYLFEKKKGHLPARQEDFQRIAEQAERDAQRMFNAGSEPPPSPPRRKIRIRAKKVEEAAAIDSVTTALNKEAEALGRTTAEERKHAAAVDAVITAKNKQAVATAKTQVSAPPPPVIPKDNSALRAEVERYSQGLSSELAAKRAEAQRIVARDAKRVQEFQSFGKEVSGRAMFPSQADLKIGANQFFYDFLKEDRDAKERAERASRAKPFNFSREDWLRSKGIAVQGPAPQPPVSQRPLRTQAFMFDRLTAAKNDLISSYKVDDTIQAFTRKNVDAFATITAAKNKMIQSGYRNPMQQLQKLGDDVSRIFDKQERQTSLRNRGYRGNQSRRLIEQRAADLANLGGEKFYRPAAKAVPVTDKLTAAQQKGAVAATRQQKELRQVNAELVQYAKNVRKAVIAGNIGGAGGGGGGRGSFRGELDEAGKLVKKQSAFKNLLDKRGGIMGAAGFATGRLGFYAIAAGAIYGLIGALRQAITSSVELQKVLAEVQGVLPTRSAQDALIIRQETIDSAKEYGVSIAQVAESAKIFAQTGLRPAEVAESLNAALAAVRGANLAMDEAREFIIAIKNITQGEVEALDILDRISRVESRRAITAQDLALAIQRIGPLVRQLKGDMSGMVDEFDIAMGAVTTIVERTRVSGVNASTSLRFILSRFGRPEIIRQIQQLSGVGLAREGGRTLRPTAEILQDISAAYQRLTAQGQTGKAFELLAAIGGARQLQATAALMENYARDTLPTARLASMSLNDTLERTNINLNTISASAARAGASWTAFASDLTERAKPGVQKLLEALGWLGDEASKALAVGANFGEQINYAVGSFAGRYQVDFVKVGDIDKDAVPRLKRLREVADQAGISMADLSHRVSWAAAAIATNLKKASGETDLNVLLEQLDKSLTGDKYRNLSVDQGQILIDSLSPIIPQIREMGVAIEQTTDPARKAQLAAEQLTLAWNILGDVAYANNALIQTNNERAKEALTGFTSTFEQALANRLTQLDTDPRALTEFFSGRGGGSDLLFKGFDADMRRIAESIFDAEGAMALFQQRLEEAFAAGDPAPFTTAMNEASAAMTGSEAAAAATLSRMKEALKENILGQGIALPESLLTQDLSPTNKRVELMAQAAQELYEEFVAAGEGGSDFAQILLQVTQIMSSPGAKSAEFLKTFDQGFSNTKQKLLDLIATFVIAVDSANKLEDAYGGIGIQFDGVKARFDATKKLFEGLSRVQNDLRKDIITTSAQQAGAQRLIRELITAGRIDIGASEFFAEGGNALTDAAIETVSARQGQTLERLSSKLKDLQKQLAETDKVDFQELFGDTDAGVAFFNIFDDFLANTLQTEGAIAAGNIEFEALVQLIAEALKIQNEVLVSRKLEIELLNAQVSVQKQMVSQAIKLSDIETERVKGLVNLEGSVTERLLGMRRNEEGLLSSTIRKEQQLASIEEDRLRVNTARQIQLARDNLDLKKKALEVELQSADSDTYRTRAYQLEVEALLEQLKLTDELDAALAGLGNSLDLKTQTAVMDTIVDKFAALEDQMVNNLTAASAGFRTLLTEYDALQKNALGTLLGSIGGTFIQRTSENFIESLVNTQKEGLLGEIMRLYASSPETKLRNNLEAALQAGGQDIASRFTIAGNSFNDRLEVIMEAAHKINIPDRVPTADANVPGTNFGVSVGTQMLTWMQAELQKEEDSKKQRKEMIKQLTTLSAAMLGAWAGGGGPMAQTGSQFGTTFGKIGGDAIAKKWGETLGGAVGTLAGPVGTIAGGVVGGLIGGMFDKDQDKKKQTAALKRIEANTRESADILELQRQLLEVSRGAFNVPSGFVLPQYTPTGGSAGRTSQQTNTFDMTINVSTNDPDGVVEVIRSEFGPMLQQELGKIGI